MFPSDAGPSFIVDIVRSKWLASPTGTIVTIASIVLSDHLHWDCLAIAVDRSGPGLILNLAFHESDEPRIVFK